MDPDFLCDFFPMVFENDGHILPVERVDPEDIIAQLPAHFFDAGLANQVNGFNEFLEELEAIPIVNNEIVQEPCVIEIPEPAVWSAEEIQSLDDFIAELENVAPKPEQSRKPIKLEKILTIEGDQIRIQGSKYGVVSLDAQEFLELFIYLHGDKMEADKLVPVVDWQVDPELLKHAR